VTPGPDPALQPTGPNPAVGVERTYVANADWSETKQVRPGDLVRYQIVVSAKGDATISAQMEVVGPNGRPILSNRGDLKVTPTAGSVFFEARIPVDAGPGTYTERATVTYAGTTTNRSSTFAVVSPGHATDPGLAGQISELTKMFWDVVTTSNTVCELLECKTVPPDVGKSISAVDHVVVIGSLANAARQAKVLGDDLATLSAELKDHQRGTPVSAKAHEIAIKIWNDNRALHKTLVGLVPGLEQAFPVPPPK